jgi:hypothetical protein
MSSPQIQGMDGLLSYRKQNKLEADHINYDQKKKEVSSESKVQQTKCFQNSLMQLKIVQV